jgi:hypothetical protein
MTDKKMINEMISNAQAMIVALGTTRFRGVKKQHIDLIIFNSIHNLDVLIDQLKEIRDEW